ncbi:MAG: hypothetical protein AAGK78_01620 [Planctomycetota bacterium]
MIRILLALVIGGGILAFLGIKQWSLKNAAKPEPTQVTYAELVSPDLDNAHVTIDNFAMPGDFIYSQNETTRQYETVYLPAIDPDGAYGEKVATAITDTLAAGGTIDDVVMPGVVASEVQVIVKTTKAKNQQQVDRLIEKESLQGIVVNKIEGIDGEVKRLLEQSYPGIDADNVILLEVDRKPPSAGKAFGMTFGGFGLTLAGIAGFVFAGKRS